MIKVSFCLTKSKKEVSNKTTYMNKLRAINKNVLKETGRLESFSNIKKYISRIIIGNCYIYGNKMKVFRLPEEKSELYSYLEEANPEKEILVDLSCVATCLCVGKGQIYTLMKKH